MKTSEIICAARDHHLVTKQEDVHRLKRTHSEYLCCAVGRFRDTEAISGAQEMDAIEAIMASLHKEYPNYFSTTWFNRYAKHNNLDKIRFGFFHPKVQEAKQEWISRLISQLEAEGN